MYKIKINSLEQLEELGVLLGKNSGAGQIICLNGELGVGKTTLTQSIAKGMGIDAYVTSPTFTLVNEYYGDRALYHFDTYRLENVEEIDMLGFDEYFYSEGVCVIEWADRIVEFLPEDYLVIDIETIEENLRELSISYIGKKSEKLYEELVAHEDTRN